MIQGSGLGGGLRYISERNGLGVKRMLEVGMFLENVLQHRVESVLGNQNLYQVVGGQHRIGPILNLATGNSLELVENGVGGGDFEGNKGRFEGNKYSDNSGGLGVKNMIQFNQVLLGKWLWQCAMEREALWRFLVDNKYDSLGGGWSSKEVVGHYGVGMWKCIMRG